VVSKRKLYSVPQRSALAPGSTSNASVLHTTPPGTFCCDQSVFETASPLWYSTSWKPMADAGAACGRSTRNEPTARCEVTFSIAYS
jgi:hypothetical protein